jgi:hypothetical protein
MSNWQLWNCGNNVPQVVGNPLAIVAQQFDMRPNPTTGVITGAVYGSNQILCGNVFSTQWLCSGINAQRSAEGKPAVRLWSFWCVTSMENFHRRHPESSL